MGTFPDMQNINYRYILELINNEEHYDKNKRVISGLEAFYLFHKRYESLQKILMPLGDKLGQGVNIISISFSNAMQDEKGIAIKYLKDDKLYMISISLFDLGIFDVALSDLVLDSDAFLEKNHDIISSIISELDQFNYIDNYNIVLNSSSKKLIIGDNCDNFMIRSNAEKVCLLETNHYLYEKDKKLFIPEKNVNDNIKINEELMDEENIQKIYNNIRIYENDFPKELIKKIR